MKKRKIFKNILIGASNVSILSLPFLSVSNVTVNKQKNSNKHIENNWNTWKISYYDLFDSNGNVKQFNNIVNAGQSLNFLDNLNYTKNYSNSIAFSSSNRNVFWPQGYKQGYTNHTSLDDVRFFNLLNKSTNKRINGSDISKNGLINYSQIWTKEHHYYSPASKYYYQKNNYKEYDLSRFTNTDNQVKTQFSSFIQSVRPIEQSYNSTWYEKRYTFNLREFENYVLSKNTNITTLQHFAEINNWKYKEAPNGVIGTRTVSGSNSYYGIWGDTRTENVYWTEREVAQNFYVDKTNNKIYLANNYQNRELFFGSTLSNQTQNEMIKYNNGVIYHKNLLNFNSQANSYLNQNFSFSDVEKSENFNINYLEITNQNEDTNSFNPDTYDNIWQRINITENTTTNISFNKIYGIPKEQFKFLIYVLANFNNVNHDDRIFRSWINSNNDIILVSDSGKDSNLDDNIDKTIFIGAKTNKEKLDELIQNKNFKLNYKGLEISFEYVYSIVLNNKKNINLSIRINDIKYNGTSYKTRLTNGVSSDLNRNKFTFFDNTNYSKNIPFIMLSMLQSYFSDSGVLLNSDVKIKTESSDLFKRTSTSLSISQKLQFNTSYVINKDFNLLNLKNERNNHNQLVLDKLVRIENADHTKNYGGKFSVNAPVTLKYEADLEETEIVFVNKKRVDVLNRRFSYNMLDNRSDINDNQRIKFYENDKNDVNDENSHKKNEYLIEVVKYQKGSNNTIIENTYKVVLVINSFDLNQKIKFYAWDPENNKDHKDLISKYLYNEKGTISDKDGNPIPNPKYDPYIDANTGTKKEIVYIDNSLFSDAVLERMHFLYPKLDINFKYGVIAEASVLGKGALRNLFANNYDRVENYFVIKLLSKEGETYNNLETPGINEIDASKGQSQASYMSNEGIYVIIANSESNISNIQLILVDKDNKPNSYFLEEIKNKNIKINLEGLDSKVGLSDFIFNFWDIKNNLLANSFLTYLIDNKGFFRETATKLNYDDIRKYYLEFINSNLYAIKDYNETLSHNIFGNTSNWKRLSLNGLVKEQKDLIIEKVKSFVIKEIDKYTNSNKMKPLIYDKDYYIEEFTSSRSTELFIEEAGMVEIEQEGQEDYLTKNINIRGIGKYRNSSLRFEYDNHANQIIYPPIDIKDIFNGLNFNNVINVAKKEVRKELEIDAGVDEELVDRVYETKIKEAIIKVIVDYLKEYNVKSPIKINLNKDIEVSNLDTVIAKLKNNNSDVYLNLIGKNANILNNKEIVFRNVGKNDIVNLNDLTSLLLSKQKFLNEDRLFDVKDKVIKFINETANEINLREYQDYLIFGNNSFIYWLDLLIDFENTEFKSESLKLKIKEAKEWIENNKFIDNEKSLLIPFTPTKIEEINKLNNHKESILESLNDKLLENVVFYKSFIILPIKQKSFNYGYGGIANYYSKAKSNEFNETGLPIDKKPETIININDNPKINEKDIEKTIEKDIENNKSNKPVTNKTDKEKARQTKRIVGYSFLGLGIVASLILLIFVAKILAKKWGWKLGVKLPKFMNKQRVK